MREQSYATILNPITSVTGQFLYPAIQTRWCLGKWEDILEKVGLDTWSPRFVKHTRTYPKNHERSICSLYTSQLEW
jgi:hypothetical protein